MKAVSNYKQVRVTLTEEPCGRSPGLVNINLRVMVKPLAAEWHMKQTVWHSTAHRQQPLSTIDDVYAAILTFLADPAFPRSHED